MSSEEKKILLINGANSTAAKALVHLCDEKKHLALLARRPLDFSAPSAFFAKADANNPDEVAAAVAQVVEKFGRVDEYVHLVGSFLLRPLHLTSIDDWRNVIETNLNSAFYGLKPVIAQMQRQKSGVIILVSSVAAKIGLANHEAIAAAKGGILSLIPTLASSYANAGIRVNGIAPGLINSAMTQRITKNAAATSASLALMALKRVGEGEDIARAIKFLLSAEASYITGQTLSVDGGMNNIKTPPKVTTEPKVSSVD